MGRGSGRSGGILAGDFRARKIENLELKLHQANEQIAQLKSALEFYAAKKTYQYDMPADSCRDPECECGRQPVLHVLKDLGRKAREALKKLEGA